MGYDKHAAEQRTFRMGIFFACVTVIALAALAVIGTNAPEFLNYLLGYPSPPSARLGAGGAGGAASPPASATEGTRSR